MADWRYMVLRHITIQLTNARKDGYREDTDLERNTGKDVTMAKKTKTKKQTVTSFAHKSFENSPSVLKFVLKLLFSIIKLH